MKKRILGGIATAFAAADIGAAGVSQAGVVAAQQANVGMAQTAAQRTTHRSGEYRGIRYHFAIKQTGRSQQQGVLKDVIPVMAGVTPTLGGGLLPTPHVSSEGYGKWDDLYIVSLDTAGTSVPGGYKDYKVEFSNGRGITLRIKSSDYVPSQITIMLNTWALDYVAANTRVTPYPIGSFWNTGQLPTAWGTNVKFVYSHGWIFVYRSDAPVPSGSTITTAPAANDDLPSEEQTTYSREVMRGIVQPW